jgi:hypothetical protein
MPITNQQVLLAARPAGAPKESDFRIVETPLREPADGELVVENRWLSLDPYMRGRMSEAKSYAKPVELGAVMIGGTVGAVIASRNAAYAVGDMVLGMLGWQRYAVSTGAGLMKIDTSRVPASAYLGAVGMPGVTAWYGLTDIGAPKAGETVVVAAASGAVGSVVGQLAKLRGCRAVGIAGGPEKCEHVVRELGFDACLDHRASDLEAQLRDATPNGIDIYFENVGGAVLDLVLKRLNPFARIPLCGLVSQYNATAPYGVKNFGALLTARATLRGFIVSEHMDRWPAALAELGALVAAGRLHYRESITRGLANAPAAFIGMLGGANFGKTLVELP